LVSDVEDPNEKLGRKGGEVVASLQKTGEMSIQLSMNEEEESDLTRETISFVNQFCLEASSSRR